MSYISAYSHTSYPTEDDHDVGNDFEFNYPDIQIPYTTPESREQAIANARVIIDGKKIQDNVNRSRYGDNHVRTYYVVDMVILETLN